MSSDEKNEATNNSADDSSAANAGRGSAPNGPQFTEGPDPLAGVKKGAADVMDSMEGKTVSMKVYVGTIIGVVVLMLLAQCSG